MVKLPGLNCGRTGLTEAQAKEAGYDVVTVLAVTDDKAHYYPDAAFFATKLIADRKTHKLLGMQVFGPGAVDKMVDIAVMAINMGGCPGRISKTPISLMRRRFLPRFIPLSRRFISF